MHRRVGIEKLLLRFQDIGVARIHDQARTADFHDNLAFGGSLFLLIRVIPNAVLMTQFPCDGRLSRGSN